MILNIQVKTSSKNSSLSIKNNIYYISLKTKAVENSANYELISILASYFNISKSSVKILKGLKSKRKIVEILEI